MITSFARFILFIITLISIRFDAIAQKSNSYIIPNLPVSFQFPLDYKIENTSKRSWIIYEEQVGTEFNVMLYKISHRFNADSLKKMMLNMYDDPEIKNLQVNEIGSGSMGGHSAEKLTLSFMAQNDKRYVSTIYMVRFHINSTYNAFLFYFEMGEKNVISYTTVQEAMITSLQYLPFVYKTITSSNDSIQSLYPDFWNAQTLDTANSHIIISDGRMNINIKSVLANDSISLDKTIIKTRDQIKINTSLYPNLKQKLTNEKLPSSEIVEIIEGSFDKDVSGYVRNMTYILHYFRRQNITNTIDYHIEFEFPTYAKEYYLPIIQKIVRETQFKGNIIISKK
jgi:hypothetical protein